MLRTPGSEDAAFAPSEQDGADESPLIDAGQQVEADRVAPGAWQDGGDLRAVITDPVVGVDRDWRYIFVNSAAEHIKGKRRTDLLGRCAWDVYPEAVGTRFQRELQRAMGDGAPVSFEAYWPAARAWFEIRAYPAHDALWVLFSDISARKADETRLRQEQERYRRLFEDSPVALYRTSADGALLDVNAALVRLLRYPDRETFLAVNAADVYADPRERRSWQALVESNGAEAIHEMADRCYDGSIIWVRDTARAIRDGSGSVLYYQGMLEDITDRKEAQEAIRESDERFRLLAAASDDVLWDWNVVTGEVIWNEALRAVFGYPPDVPGRGIEQSYAWWRSHVHLDERDRVSSALHDAVDQGASDWSAQYRFRRLNGSYANVLERGYIGRDEAGRPVRMIGALLDLERGSRPAEFRDRHASFERPPVPVTSDATLISWIGRGDERAFDELYGRHAPMTYALAHSALAERADAEEVVADVFLEVWRTARRFRFNEGSVTGWLASIARSRVAERLRRTHRRQRLAGGALPQAHGLRALDANRRNPETLPDSVEYEALQRSLAQLPEPQRRVLELAYFNGLSHGEIAKRLHEPLGTVKTRIRTGLAKLRRALEPHDGPAGE